MTTDAEMGLLQPPEARGGEQGCSPGAFGGAVDFGPLASRTERINFCCFQPRVCGGLWWQPQEAHPESS